MTTTKGEIWKNVPEYNGLYQASSLGRVRSAKTGRILKRTKTIRGFLVGLSKDGTAKNFRVSTVMVKTFLSKKQAEAVEMVDYKDGNLSNCALSNLTVYKLTEIKIRQKRKTS